MVYFCKLLTKSLKQRQVILDRLSFYVILLFLWCSWTSVLNELRFVIGDQANEWNTFIMCIGSKCNKHSIPKQGLIKTFLPHKWCASIHGFWMTVICAGQWSQLNLQLHKKKKIEKNKKGLYLYLQSTNRQAT